MYLEVHPLQVSNLIHLAETEISWDLFLVWEVERLFLIVGVIADTSYKSCQHILLNYDSPENFSPNNNTNRLLPSLLTQWIYLLLSDIPADAILELFGKTFFEFCQDSGYDKILQVLGATPRDFLQVRHARRRKRQNKFNLKCSSQFFSEFRCTSRPFGYFISWHESTILQMYGEEWKTRVALLFRPSRIRIHSYRNSQGTSVLLTT